MFIGYLLEAVRPHCLITSLIRPWAYIYEGLISWWGAGYALEIPIFYYAVVSQPLHLQEYSRNLLVLCALITIFLITCALTVVLGKKFDKNYLLVSDMEEAKPLAKRSV